MHLLGIDYGRIYLGLAISYGRFPKALTVVKSKSDEHKIAEITRICNQEQITKIIIGKGSGQLANHIRGFTKKLKQKLNLEIIAIDEDLTSNEAVETMIMENVSQKMRKTQEHAYAASLLLKLYLEKETDG